MRVPAGVSIIVKMQSEPDADRSLLPLFGLAIIVLLVFVWAYAR